VLQYNDPLDGVPEADLTPIHLFIDSREYVGRAVVRPFDPAKTRR
jgi:hypothetical protein